LLLDNTGYVGSYTASSNGKVKPVPHLELSEKNDKSIFTIFFEMAAKNRRFFAAISKNIVKMDNITHIPQKS
jgi:hypothetical protein